MGDYQGTRVTGGAESPLCAQVMALGDGRFRANMLDQFDKRVEPLVVLDGRLAEGAVGIQGTAPDGTLWSGEITQDGFAGKYGGTTFTLHRVVRLSPTMGAPAPKGAVVLFDGKSMDEWAQGGMQRWVVDLGRLVGGQNCVAYLTAEVRSPAAQKALLELGSDDGVKAWLNGQMVHENNALRGLQAGEDKVPVDLREGWNTLILKVSQGGGGWAATARLREPDGSALGDIEVRAAGIGPMALSDTDGYVAAWGLSGAYTREGAGPTELLDIAFPPEGPQQDTKWRPVGPKDLSGFGWTLTPDGAMEVRPGAGSAVTRRRFADQKLHLEFRTPFEPRARGQARGNSGVYVQGIYEVQVLDSYGLKGEDNECGGIYQIARPLVNMCAPPLQWQTYDITFHAARFGPDGRKLSDARITVLHNGVTIHDDLVLPHATPGGVGAENGQPGPLMLQDHGDLVQYRNIWVVELPEKGQE